MHILVDGIDGAGKSTLCSAVRGILQEKQSLRGASFSQLDEVAASTSPAQKNFGMKFFQIHQPDAKHLHGRAHDPNVTHLERVLHFLANRRQQVEDLLPKLVGPHVVLCDRGAPATWVYDKVYGFPPHDRKVTEEMIGLCNKGIEPFLYVWLDTPPQEAYERLQKRGEKETLAHLQELRYGFQLFLDRNPMGWPWLTTVSGGTLGDQADRIVDLVMPQLRIDMKASRKVATT